MLPVVFIPGYGNSGPDHWQSVWERTASNASRVSLGDWLNPVATEWTARLSEFLVCQNRRSILVAHSLGCLLVAHYLDRFGPDLVAGAFLVAPPDPRGPNFPSAIRGFEITTTKPFKVPTLVVSSTNDPYAAPDFALRYAALWEARHHSIEGAGHINTDSGYGPWNSGRELFDAFAEDVERNILRQKV